MDLASSFCVLKCFPEPFVEDVICSPMLIFDIFVKVQVAVATWTSSEPSILFR